MDHSPGYGGSLVVVFAPTSATYAASGRNNPNAKLCQKGGWQNYQRTDGTRFVNEEACVSYAAQGGTLVPIPSDTTPPGCSIALSVYGDQFFIRFTAQDLESGLASIVVTQSDGVGIVVPAFTPGTTDPVIATKLFDMGRYYIAFTVTDRAGNSRFCEIGT
jgi:hypothetical protein